MARFLVELYGTRSDEPDPAGLAVLRTIFVPEEETWFLLVEAPARHEVTAALPHAHIADAVEVLP
jgi:hypothetical protein